MSSGKGMTLKEILAETMGPGYSPVDLDEITEKFVKGNPVRGVTNRGSQHTNCEGKTYLPAADKLEKGEI